jgi:thioredoxin-related protein
MKQTLIILLLIFTVVSVSGQGQAKAESSSVKWYTLQEAENLSKKSPKPLFIDTYTDWCGWCKKMDKETFTDPVISEILNTRFYPVKFNAEGKESITFLGQNFINDGKAGNAHQLAVALLNGQLSYPTVVFMTFQADGKLAVSPVPGFKQPKEMEILLSFFADKAYEKQTWEQFQAGFRGRIQ